MHAPVTSFRISVQGFSWPQ